MGLYYKILQLVIAKLNMILSLKFLRFFCKLLWVKNSNNVIFYPSISARRKYRDLTFPRRKFIFVEAA